MKKITIALLSITSITLFSFSSLLPFNMIKVDGAKFMMGSKDQDITADVDEQKEHEVNLDNFEIKKLIEQVYQFSRLYWKSLRQQNVPITIKYPEMVAEIAPHFESGNIPPHGKEILWFL